MDRGAVDEEGGPDRAREGVFDPRHAAAPLQRGLKPPQALEALSAEQLLEARLLRDGLARGGPMSVEPTRRWLPPRRPAARP